MSQPSIKHLASGGVITHYHCVSTCGHRLYNSGPHRSKAYLEPDQAETIFRRILDLGCRAVHIGGGAPMLKPELLAVCSTLPARLMATPHSAVSSSTIAICAPISALIYHAWTACSSPGSPRRDFMRN